jgi:hypothetical protein
MAVQGRSRRPIQGALQHPCGSDSSFRMGFAAVRQPAAGSVRYARTAPPPAATVRPLTPSSGAPVALGTGARGRIRTVRHGDSW